MKINKNLIDLLTKEKLTRVSDLLGRDGLGMIINGEKTLDSLEKIEEVFYTIDFLAKENFIIIKQQAGPTAPHIGNCLKNNLKDDKRSVRHLIDANQKLEEYYGKEIKTNFTIYDFIKNGYRTNLQRERGRNLWLPISIAIGTSIGIPLLTVLFNKLFLCN